MSDDEVSVTMHFGDEVVQLDLTAEDAFDYMHRGQAIGHVGDGEPFIDEDGQLGERHVTLREQALRRRQEDDRADP